MRLQRLAPKALLKADDAVVVPMQAPGKVDGMRLVEGLLTLLAELVPEGSEAIAATSSA